MLRTEAYPIADGLLLMVATSCDGTRHAGTPCRRETAVTVVHSEEIEAHGVASAWIDALNALFTDHPSMADQIMC